MTPNRTSARRKVNEATATVSSIKIHFSTLTEFPLDVRSNFILYTLSTSNTTIDQLTLTIAASNASSASHSSRSVHSITSVRQRNHTTSKQKAYNHASPFFRQRSPSTKTLLGVVTLLTTRLHSISR